MEPSDIYGLPLDRFIPERNALAKQLRVEGRRDEATRVAALRKPSVAAWAVNQVLRTQQRDVQALFDAGDALQRAQSELLSGRGDAGALREAAERERGVVEELATRARGLLSSEGRELTQATLERVSETLHAAALDDDARATVKDGCLTEELRHAGLGAGGAVTPRTGGRRGDAHPGKSGAAGKQKPGRDAAAERELAKRREDARKAESDARRAAERAARELQDAERRRDRAAQTLEEAEAKVRAAREHAKEAAREHERAQGARERG